MPRGRTVAISAAVAVVLAGAAAGGAYYVLHTRGTPQETAARFTAAWSRGDLAAMKAELASPAAGFDAAYAELTKNLAVAKVAVRDVRAGAAKDDRATASYTATATVKNVGDWTYKGSLKLVVKDHYWKVDWSPSAVHPALDGTNHLALKTSWPQRAAVTDANGDRIDGGDVGGSVQQLVGFLDKAGDDDVEKLGTAYKKGDAVGRGGLQETFQKQLAGTPTTEIQVVGESRKTLHSVKGSPGKDLRTSLDLKVQKAAADAVRDLDKPTSLVAVKPSTGEILAVVNNRGGFNRALDGKYAPGSTFKTVTAAGLLAEGLTPSSRVTCPKEAVVGGLKIRNSDHEAFGSLSFLDSYAHSCNTTFAPLAAQKLGARKLYDLATDLGFNQPLRIGVPATPGSMPKATSEAELAAESFGQARITASPLVIASVAAAVADGSWRPPTLVPSLEQKTGPKQLPEEVVKSLRSMMRAVVTKGTAHAAGLPAGTAGKTGTAEFGTGPELDSHAWFMGFRGDLAFAVVVEAGGMGGEVAAPVAAHFLKSLS
ncbi:penicillin-binding transpeptidase domain-containing protein [Microbispora sp. H10830]|uniref:penicillin-binding transpeptidase domain-containing protein n=1 Tax=Microbispora sp. H10830 TaxID=2729109 RepID=UPI001603B941|nr:penicillin-binding transpeptidase domain-containing protein [Microbispora sp. H10830]